MTAPTRDSVLTVLDEWAAAAAADAAAAARADVQAQFQAQLDAAAAQAAQLQAELDAAIAAAGARTAPRKPYPVKGGPAGDITGGVLTLRDAGIVLEGWDIPGWVQNPGTGTTLRHCTVRGTKTALAKPLPGYIYSTGKNALLEDVIVVPDAPQNGPDGLFLKAGATVRDLETYHVTDGIGIASDDVLVENPYVHDLLLTAPDTPNKRPAAHCDAVQVHTGRNIVIRGGRLIGFLAPYLGDALRPKNAANSQGGYNPGWNVAGYALQSNSAIMVNQLAGTDVDVTLDGVFLDGGAVHLNIAANIVKPGQVKTRGLVFGGHPVYRGQFVKDPNKVIVAI